MQTRISFNGGEIDEDVSLRQDVEGMQRACLVLENWRITDGGAVERRPGMSKVRWSSAGARIVPYIYSHAPVDNVRFLVEITEAETHVLNLWGGELASFNNQEKLGHLADPQGLEVCQLNALLIFTSLKHPPYVLKYDTSKGYDWERWSLEPYKLDPPPWEDNEERDGEIRITSNDRVNINRVEFLDGVPDGEKGEVREGDVLRVSWWIEEKECKESMDSILKNCKVQIAPKNTTLNLQKGDKVAVLVDDSVQGWVCKQDWVKKDIYREGLEDPSSYPSNFVQMESGTDSVSVWGTTISEAVACDLNVDKSKITAGTKFGLRIAYWYYFTCIKAITTESREISWYRERPEYFRPGVRVGESATCRGPWQFFCSGLWYGEYEIKRNFETDDIYSQAWESAGVSFSKVGAAKNTEITGDESEEECYLQLYIINSRLMGDPTKDTDIQLLKKGFPADVCNNKLIVEGYTHDEILEWKQGRWERTNKIKPRLEETRVTGNWSWSAFSWRYGYPMHACTYNKRLVFAATSRKPQSLFFSCVDDLTNFFVTSGESSAFTISLTTGTQNPICWLAEKGGSILLGTSEGEWEFGPASTTSGVSASNNMARTHSFNGSANYVSVIGTKNRIVYVQRGGKRVNDFGYDLEVDGYRSRDISIMNQHITGEHNGIVRGAMVNVPRCELFFVLGDGQVAVCTYNDDQSVKAWGRWVTNGEVKDVCTITNGNSDDLIYFIVKRGDEYNIERVGPESPYQDNYVTGSGSWGDYESVIVTNALCNIIEQKIEKQANIPFKIRLGKDFDNGEAGAMQVSRDGEKWVNIDKRSPVLKKGWIDLVALPGWMEEPKMGVKVRGIRECEIICMQG